jgi:hypothetical protein
MENYQANFIPTVTEVKPGGNARCARFSCRAGFRREAVQDGIDVRDGIQLKEANLQVRYAVLNHKLPWPSWPGRTIARRSIFCPYNN